MTEPLIRAENLGKTFSATSGFLFTRNSDDVRAVDGVSFAIMARLSRSSENRDVANPRWAGCCSA